MSAASPRFWAGPVRYCRWAARERPAYLWSVVIGATGPVILAVVPPVRKMIGDEDAPQIPLTYPGMAAEAVLEQTGVVLVTVLMASSLNSAYDTAKEAHRLRRLSARRSERSGGPWHRPQRDRNWNLYQSVHRSGVRGTSSTKQPSPQRRINYHFLCEPQ